MASRMMYVVAVLFLLFGTTEVQGAGSMYDFEVKDINGEMVSLSKYRETSPVVLVVNVASECGFTHQYGGLQELHEKYSSQGFSVLGFPCNQFGSQEPGSDEDIQKFASEQYGVTFPLFSKVEVNGEGASELFNFLKESAGGWFTDAIKWNFTKFLVVDGVPVQRYSSLSTAYVIDSDIRAALAARGLLDDREKMTGQEL